MSKILLRNHYFLTSAPLIDEICEPLKLLGILHFNYLKNFNDESQINLSNHAKWVEDYYQLNLHTSSLFERKPTEYKSGFSLWPEDYQLEVLRHGKEYFNSANGITFVEKEEDGCAFYFFSGAADNRSLVNFYLNNIDFLQNFIEHFKEKAQKILKESYKHRITISNHFAENETTSFDYLTSLSESQWEELRQQALAKMTNDSNNEVSIKLLLSRRELQCIELLSAGKSAKETSLVLSISNRTVEKHFENIKDKLNCKKKSEIIYLLMKKAGNQFLAK